MNSDLTQAEARRLFTYDADSGNLLWKVGHGGRSVGAMAGRVTDRGYRRIIVHGKQYRAHRVVWLMAYGEWPKMIDHINGDKLDNRLSNLRLATSTQNQCNRGKRSDKTTSRYKGVHFDRSKGKWIAQIRFRKKLKHIGTFAREEDAFAAYWEQAQKLFGEFANAG